MQNKLRLVLIDDDPGVIRALGLLLHSMQYQVSSFTSPSDALAFITNHSTVDLVVTDLRMPEISGELVLKELRKHSVDLPIILMSGHATTSEVAELRRLGASGFIPKPFTPNQFTAVVNSIPGLAPRGETAFA